MENLQHLGAGHSPLSPVVSPDKYINAVAEAETKKHYCVFVYIFIYIYIIENNNFQ